MFEWMKRFCAVLVTGPARSGTKICARMIAHDAGHTYVDEHEIGYTRKSNPAMLPSRIDRARLHGEKIVVQCPGWMGYISELSAPDVLIVITVRDVDEIVRSMKSIGWDFEPRPTKEHISGVYDVWEKRGAPRCQNTISIAYNSLSEHPLWMPREERGHWKRNDEWRKRSPCLLFISIQGFNNPWAQLAHELLGGEGIDTMLYETNLDGAGVQAHIMELGWRPHYAILFARERKGLDKVAIPARLAGCKTVVVCGEGVAWGAKSIMSIPAADIVIADYGIAIDALRAMGHGSHPRELGGVSWYDPVAKEWRE